MDKEVEEKVYEGIDGFFTKLTEAADAITAKLIEVTPEAAEAILNLVQFKGIFHIILATPFVFGIPIFIYKLWKHIIKHIAKKKEESGYYDSFPIIFPVSLITAGAILPFCIALFDGWSFYNWLSAFYPEGAIALKALHMVGVDL